MIETFTEGEITKDRTPLQFASSLNCLYNRMKVVRALFEKDSDYKLEPDFIGDRRRANGKPISERLLVVKPKVTNRVVSN